MTHKFDSGGFFTFLVALAHGVAPPGTTGLSMYVLANVSHVEMFQGF